jgi:hypothetical protein
MTGTLYAIRKDTAAIRGTVLHVVLFFPVEPWNDVRDSFSVHQGLCTQNGEARRIGKGGRDKIEIIVNADDVRIGIVSMERRIGTGAVTPVGLPCVRVGHAESQHAEHGDGGCFEGSCFVSYDYPFRLPGQTQQMTFHTLRFISAFPCDYLKMCWAKRYRLLAHSVPSWAWESTCQTCGTFFSLR